MAKDDDVDAKDVTKWTFLLTILGTIAFVGSVFLFVL